MDQTIREIAAWALPVLLAIIFHEVAHGWVAFRLGDPTAARMGRLTLNPIAHIDLFGTILIPLLLIISRAPFVFGYAKPVPVNFHNLNHPKRDMIWVAAAGPATNIVIAIASVYLLNFLQSSQSALPGVFQEGIVFMAQSSIQINAMLAAFNLLPVPPLDGGRVAVGLLPEPLSSAVARVEPYGFFIILILLVTHTLDVVMNPLLYVVVQIIRGLVIG